VNIGAAQSEQEETTVSGSKLIPSLFHRFLDLEKQCKLANEGKAAIFAEAKEKRLDARALRVAFRLEMRELDQPGSLQKHEAMNSLTTRYLAALRGDERMEGNPSPDSTETPLRELLSVAQPNLDTRARSRAREDAAGTDPMQVRAPKLELGPKSTAANLKLALEDEPEIPECLRAKPRAKATGVDPSVSTHELTETPEMK
jgi:hypothetical protein